MGLSSGFSLKPIQWYPLNWAETVAESQEEAIYRSGTLGFCFFLDGCDILPNLVMTNSSLLNIAHRKWLIFRLKMVVIFHSYVNVHQRVYDSYDMFVDLGDDHPLTCHFKYIFSLNCFPDSWPITFHSQFVPWKNWRAPIWLSHFLFLNMMVPWWTRTQMLLEQNLGMWRNTLEVLPFLKKHIFKKDQTGPINTPMVVS